MEMLPEEKNLLKEIRATGVEIDDIEELMHMDSALLLGLIGCLKITNLLDGPGREPFTKT